LRVRELARDEAFGVSLIAGREGADAEIRSAHASDLPHPGRYVFPGELVLTNGLWLDSTLPETWVREIAEAGAVGMGFGLTAAWPAPPDDLTAHCDESGFPLLAVPEDVSFAAISQHVFSRGADSRDAALRRQLQRQRRLVQAAMGPDRHADLLAVLAQETELRGGFVSPAGEVLACSVRSVPSEIALAAAQSALDRRLPRVLGDTWTAFGEPGGGVHSTLVVQEAISSIDDEARLLLEQLIAFAGFADARADGEALARRRLTEELIARLRTEHLASAELDSRLAAIGLDPTRDILVVCSTADRQRLAIAAAHVGVTYAVASVEDAVLLLIEDPQGTTPKLLQDALRRLGSADTALGVAGPANDAGGLRAAIAGALMAQRASASEPGQVLRTVDDVASAPILMTMLDPTAVTAYRNAVLGHVLDWDERHGTDLQHTLRVFLGTGGRWQAAAEALHIHHNTLRYRLDRVEQLTGRKLNVTADRVDLFLALASDDVSAAPGVEQ
jgi:PucR family transcriptional regulator, purine catabolism regulatory protein